MCLALHLDQRPDDFVHVAAGAEIAASTGDHDVLDVVRIGEVAERISQLGVGFERQRILPFRPVQGDSRHLTVDLPKEMRWLEIGKIESGGAKACRGVATTHTFSHCNCSHRCLHFTVRMTFPKTGSRFSGSCVNLRK
jgi:hypothetical protein